ncbi:hypothetical protein [Methanothermococcus okinawensis]|uniref:Uncharacterized protein n=1 Tax=Methanothermococcus okinawensis (strain DSM 14208 / JCM 11175 / IH1) TaxID=647113 RepID=F8AL13_METOI|nr:hypothetical protein [Methanothermococcus okinawensis]AEH06448.1 hypothetical protein Metok_0466 [Methanothermococcus okinawensis IH1]
MKLNLLKGFAAVAMLCMVGAVFAEPISTGDISLGLMAASYLDENPSYAELATIALNYGIDVPPAGPLAYAKLALLL